MRFGTFALGTATAAVLAVLPAAHALADPAWNVAVEIKLDGNLTYDPTGTRDLFLDGTRVGGNYYTTLSAQASYYVGSIATSFVPGATTWALAYSLSYSLNYNGTPLSPTPVIDAAIASLGLPGLSYTVPLPPGLGDTIFEITAGAIPFLAGGALSDAYGAGPLTYPKPILVHSPADGGSLHYAIVIEQSTMNCILVTSCSGAADVVGLTILSGALGSTEDWASTYQDLLGLGTDPVSPFTLSASLTLDLIDVPEPASAALFSLGLLGLGAVRRRRGAPALAA